MAAAAAVVAVAYAAAAVAVMEAVQGTAAVVRWGAYAPAVDSAAAAAAGGACVCCPALALGWQQLGGDALGAVRTIQVKQGCCRCCGVGLCTAANTRVLSCTPAANTLAHCPPTSGRAGSCCP